MITNKALKVDVINHLKFKCEINSRSMKKNYENNIS